VGGSLPMAERMTEKFVSLGGRLKTRKRVTKILVENDQAKGVLLDDGTEIAADYIISAADGHNTLFSMLEGRYLTKKIKKAYDTWELFTPIVQVSFGINRIIPSDSPNELHMVPDCMIGRTKTINGYSFMNYQFDPTMAPEGKSVIVMRYESPWELWKDISPAEYEEEKKKIEEDARALLLKHYPGLEDSVEVTDVATPLTDVKYTGVWKGSYEGFLPSSKNLMDNIPPVLPGLKKFYMAGQWLFPGGGLPPAGQSGKWAVQYICRDEKKSFRTK
ncbi:MAG: FAD-dependent oxidoreductase, partial [Bacteroidales bacterium]|nr:FAD-dependent oxidoreductase [Bacteroidales bacterium]